MTTIAVVGLGYVGLPLAVEFGKKYRTIGFDLSAQKIESYKRFLELAPSSSPDRADAIRALKQLGGPVPE